MKKIMALTAAVSMLALFVLTSQASAQTQGTLTADPPTVPAAGQHSFTVTGSGFNAGTSLNVLPCTLSGAELTPDSTAAEISAAADRMNPFADCDLGNLTPVTVDSSGNFSAQVSARVGTNFAWAAGDVARTQSGLVPVFIVAPAEEEATEEEATEEEATEEEATEEEATEEEATEEEATE
ncbi:MAG: hypothetical protein OXC00_07785, partial [Acidimicrobiaceae bacterium]|nr:hypothetical protein [Acidimicrobiaceae bacterium]